MRFNIHAILLINSYISQKQWMILQHKHISLKDGWFSEQGAGKQTLVIQFSQFMVAVRSQHSATQGNKQAKQLNGGINRIHTLSTEILIKIIANVIMVCGFTFKLYYRLHFLHTNRRHVDGFKEARYSDNRPL